MTYEAKFDVRSATKDDLEAMTRDALRAIAKDMSIAGRGSMTKAQLVEAIFAAAAEIKQEQENLAAASGENAEKVENKREKYAETASIGTIVAFKLPNGKVKSAKIINRSVSRKMLLLVTSYGKEFRVPFEDVVWVKTGSRWPRAVYNLLKGEGAENGEGKA